jgi:DNA-binding NarL/FixJ family response regulator
LRGSGEAVPASTPTELTRPDSGTERRKVLVLVEDEPDMRAVIRAMLSIDRRLEIIGEASSAPQAIELARSVEPGLIILDHWIDGEITGLQAAPLLKEAAPNAKILLFTAYDMKQAAEGEPAIDAYLRKDSIADLLPTVQGLLDLN